jgi:two-component system sensor histidine kinase PilS (NtrC family)
VKPRALDLDALLRAFCWGRLAVAGILVGLGPWAPAVFVPTASTGLLLAALTVVLGSSGVLLVLGRSSRPSVVAWLLCLLDAALVTAAVAATGGARSILVFLYVLLVTAACLLLPRSGALAVALVSSGLYATLVLARDVVPALAFDEPVDRTAAFDMLTILVTAGTLTIVSVVAGGLAERFLVSQRELERERRSLGDLQVFSDVIFQSVGTGLVALDRTRRITAFNRAAEAMTGMPVSTALGATWTDVFGDGPSVDDIEATISGQPRAPARREIDLHRPDGTIIPVGIITSALEAGDGVRSGCIAVCEDLSSVRAMEAQMRQADRLATLGRMAANIAHEVRNPLASLSGAVETLTSADVAGETRARLTEIVLRESARLSEIIENVLAYAHPAPLVMERMDAAVVLDDVLCALPQRLSTDGVKVVRAFPASLPLEADLERFRQVVWTLCVNALGAMPTGGELRLEALIRTGMVEISVSDTGDGIPPQDLAHAFEPFFATHHDATGLGLALVHRIVHEHGGEVTVRSEHGLGAEFTVRFPERHA